MTLPRLRPLEPTWIEYEGQPALVLRDRLGISQTVIVPQGVALILALCDGTRDAAGIAAALALRHGAHLPAPDVQGILDQLEAALILEGPAVDQALIGAIEDYRSAPHRPPALTDLVYPAGLAELTQA
ncbi:MAG TPA: hypothetical protein VHL09_12560, partial [Dehalococcoidia bacterium]|nr:hypothetical protein [Dehalococcoidia bacterium]